jgi:ABC-type Fe3+/spermidine/putrescine transport system ATPase subunit
MSDCIAILDEGRVVQIGDPTALYRRPASRFVAEFVGETNLIPGRVSGQTPDGVTIETGIGTLESSDRFSGSNAVCCVRPESIRLGNGKMQGIVSEVVYLGDSAHVDIRIRESVLRASIANPRIVPVSGDVVGIDISPEDVALIPA